MHLALDTRGAVASAENGEPTVDALMRTGEEIELIKSSLQE